MALTLIYQTQLDAVETLLADDFLNRRVDESPCVSDAESTCSEPTDKRHQHRYKYMESVPQPQRPFQYNVFVVRQVFVVIKHFVAAWQHAWRWPRLLLRSRILSSVS